MGENNFWLEPKKWSNEPSKAQLNKMSWQLLGGAEHDLKPGLANCSLLMRLNKNKNKKSCPVPSCSDGHTLLASALACHQSVHLRLTSVHLEAKHAAIQMSFSIFSMQMGNYSKISWSQPPRRWGKVTEQVAEYFPSLPQKHLNLHDFSILRPSLRLLP